jgi:hypothetical protein
MPPLAIAGRHKIASIMRLASGNPGDHDVNFMIDAILAIWSGVVVRGRR